MAKESYIFDKIVSIRHLNKIKCLSIPTFLKQYFTLSNLSIKITIITHYYSLKCCSSNEYFITVKTFCIIYEVICIIFFLINGKSYVMLMEVK